MNMVMINNQLNSTNKNYLREKKTYVSINYSDPITQNKKSIVDLKKRHIKNNISGTLAKMY